MIAHDAEESADGEGKEKDDGNMNNFVQSCLRFCERCSGRTGVTFIWYSVFIRGKPY